MLLWLYQDCTEVCRTDLVAKASAIRGRIASVKPLEDSTTRVELINTFIRNVSRPVTSTVEERSRSIA
jgi:hypothetical protein